MPSTTPDLANDILSLNRTTERMILSSFQFTTRKNKKTVEIIDDVLGMEWNEKTHQVTTTVTPATDHDPKTITLTISVHTTQTTRVDIIATFTCVPGVVVDYQPTHVNITVTDQASKSHANADRDPSWAIVAVVLRRLLAQRYLFNENARRIAQGKPAQLRDIDQESAWKEDMWAKRGLTEFIDQVMNQQ